ncbi:MAG: AarF/UbiB family protein [Eubacteriales bacterium]|nr:AarF/UbiB family protein [Eubacteriales bacterium]
MGTKAKSTSTGETQTMPQRLKEILQILAEEKAARDMTPEKLRRILERLGPTFVKIGQIMSMREDILPPAYCQELTKLRMQVVPLPFEAAEAVVKKELGDAYAQIMRIEQAPLGSASIAQVHRAWLAPDERPVVLKIQRPGIEGIMKEDFHLLRRAAHMLEITRLGGTTINFEAVLDEMENVTVQELDFLQEASHLQKFSELHTQIVYTGCPKAEMELCTPRLLVMEYVDGIPIDDVPRLTALGYNMKEIGEKVAESYSKQIMDDAFFHADPHPGNLFVRDGQIIWMDMGMMGTISGRDRNQLKKAVQAVIDHDVSAVKEVVLSMGVQHSPVNHSRLYNDIDLLLDRYADTDLAQINLGTLMSEAMDVARAHDISMPRGVTMLMRGLLTIEGVILLCAPDLSFMTIAASHLAGDLWGKFDVKKEGQRLAKYALHTTRHMAELPGMMSELTGMLIKGQSKVNLEVVGSEEPLRKLGDIVNNAVLALIDAALVMGSSILCTTAMKPQVLGIPVLGFLGFVAAAVLGGYLVVDIFRRRARRGKS